MKKKRKLLILCLELLAAAGIFLAILIFQRQAEERDKAQVSEEELQRRYSPSIIYQDQSYPLKRNTSSLLLIGTDNFADDEKQLHGELTYNYNLADFLVILVFDHSSKTVVPFQICRDTICGIPIRPDRTVMEQITLSHTYGSGGKDSCIITRNAVEGLLFGVPLDRYMSFTMDTVPLMNDLVGGVTVKLEDDIPALGPAYVKGAEVELRGSDALRFVRYRDTSLLDDNLRRMTHHRIYLEAFMQAARNAIAEDPDLVTKAFKKIEGFLCTDLTLENVSELVDQLCSYEICPVVSASGSYCKGERFPEFHADETSLWNCVFQTFCK